MASRVIIDCCSWRYFVKGDLPLVGELVAARRALLHPWVEGELSLGSPLPLQVRRDMKYLSRTKIVPWRTMMDFIQDAKLSNQRIGWADTQVLCTCYYYSTPLLTVDKRLDVVARRLGLSFLTSPHTG